MSATVVRKANPNRHGWIKLLAYPGIEGPIYVVVTPDDEDGTEFDGDRVAAENYYNDVVKSYAETPNWDAQAEYDDYWGSR